jgi:RNA polymerase sigma factor (sigma-70 family)
MKQPAIDWQAALAQHQRWLRTVVFARVREAQAVEDVMQEVALAAVKQQAPLVEAGKISPWLYRLAVLQSLIYRRKCGRRRKLNDRYSQRVERGEHEPTAELDPVHWLLADERRKLIRLALSRLSGRDAELLLLKYTEGWNYHQIAAHLGISHAAVEARLHRARAKLRQELAALNVIEVPG